MSFTAEPGTQQRKTGVGVPSPVGAAVTQHAIPGPRCARIHAIARLQVTSSARIAPTLVTTIRIPRLLGIGTGLVTIHR